MLERVAEYLGAASTTRAAVPSVTQGELTEVLGRCKWDLGPVAKLTRLATLGQMTAEKPNPWDELRLNTQSPVPLWVQLGRELRRCIAEHKLPVGTPLPTEPWIITRHGMSAKDTGRTYKALRDIGQIGGKRGEGYHVAEEIPMQYVTVVPGSKITAPAPHDPTIKSDVPWWAVIALRVEPPGMEPIDFDATRTVLLVA